jgi:hypothetical protein
LIASGFCLLGPLLMPALERTSAVRLLLLPIRRETLYVAQTGSAISDPWVILALPIVVAVPVGLLAGGAPLAASYALAAGLLVAVILVGLSALATFLLNLVVRDRRRGELVALLFVIVPCLLMLPGVLTSNASRDERRAEQAAAAERRAKGEETLGDQFKAAAEASFGVLPTELYTTGVHAAAARDWQRTALPLAGLVAFSLAIHGLGMLVFGRLLELPSGGGRQRAVADTSSSTSRLPGLSRASSAIAIAQLRLATRTTRGKSTILSPMLVFLMMVFVSTRNSGQLDIGVTSIAGGLGLAAFASMVCLLSILPFSMNQFATDRAGLTMTMLAPVPLRDVLIGKAVGVGSIAFLPATACTAVAALYFRSGSPALWLSLPLALAATIALASPAAAALSALFPRQVDLNSIGRGSNAHGLAAIVGFLLYIVAAAPAALIIALCVVLLRRPALTPILMVLWCGGTVLVARLLLATVADLVERRRENLIVVARGR